MAFNAYLVFHPDKNDIKGESTSELFKDQGAIEIADYGFATAMPVTASRSDGGGATVGRANFESFTCNKNIDTSTPKLVDYCCQGKNITKICLHLFRAGDDSGSGTGAVKYAMVVFRHCVITKVGISGGGEELPKESLEFNYGVCEYHYQQTDHEKGTKVGDVRRFAWSTVNNKSFDQMEKF